MSIKKWFKNGVAILLTICMTVGLLSAWEMSASNASDGYTELTFSDFGIANQEITGKESEATVVTGPNATVNSTGLDKIAITGYVTFDASASTASYIQFGNILQIVPANTNQFGFWKIGTGWIGWSNDLGTAILGQKIKIRFAFDASGDDYVLKTYINDNEAAVVTVGNGVSSFTWRDLCFAAEPNKTLLVESYKETPEVVEPTEYSVITFSDFNLADQTVSAGGMVNNASEQVNSAEGLNGKAFVGYVTFPTSCTPNGTKLQFGNLLALTPNADGTLLLFVNPNNNTEFGMTEILNETVLGKEIKIRLEFYISGSDYILNSYIDDVPMGKVTLTSGVDLFTWHDLCAVSGTNEQISIRSFVEQEEPAPIVYKDMSLGDFGIADDTYRTHIVGTPIDTTITSLDKVAFTTTLTFAEDVNSQVRIGGTDAEGWSAPITLHIVNGKLYAWNYIEATKSLALADVALREQFVVRVEMSYSGADVDVNYYVNNMEVPVVTAKYENYKDKFAPRILLYATDSAEVAVGEESQLSPLPEPLEQKTPEELGYTQISLPHFALEDGAYEPGKVPGDHWYEVYQEEGSVSGKYLDVNIAFGGEKLVSDRASIRYATANGWEGISIAVEENALRVFDASVGGGYSYTLEQLGMSTFADAFNLKLGITFGQEYETGEKDITFCLWVNNTLIAKDELLSKVKGVGNGMGIYAGINPISLSTPEGVTGPEPIAYKEMSLGDFGISDGTYTSNVVGTPKDTKIVSLDKVAITATLNFASEIEPQLRIGGTDKEGWNGPISLYVVNGKLYAWNYIETTKSVPLTDVVAREKFMIRMEFDYSGKDVNVKYYVNDMTSPVIAVKYENYKEKFAPRVLVYATDNAELAVGENSQLTPPPEPLVQKTPEELGYSPISLPHFAMKDGKYEPGKVSGNHWYNEYQEEGDINGKYLDLNIAFAGKELKSDSASIRYASANGWESVSIAVEGDVLRVFDASVGGGYTYTLEELGIVSFSKEFNLKFGVMFGKEYETGERDLTFCLWINNKLIAKDAKLSKVKGVGNGMGIYVAKNAIVLSTPKSVVIGNNGKVEKLPTDFRKVTFQSFEIEAGKYTYKPKKLADEGAWVLPMDKTLFSGDIYFSSEVGSDFRYGGAQNAWCGLYFYTAGGVDGKSDGKIYMNLVVPEATDNPLGLLLETPYVFQPYFAQTDLINQWINLKISTEFVDSDKDGQKDDVKLGVWFNDVLYNNQYIYLNDYAKYLGSYAGISVSAEESFVKVRQDKTVDMEIDYSLFGFTDNWVKEFGL